MSFTGDLRLKTPSCGILKNNVSGGILGGSILYLEPTFYAGFVNGRIDILASGSRSYTFTASRGASNPAVYYDSNGVMQKTETSDELRFTYGYHDINGYNTFDEGSGFIIEGQQTNYLIHSIFDTDGGSGISLGWSADNSVTGSPSYSLVDISSEFNIGTNVNSQRWTYTGIAGDDETKKSNIVSDLTAVGSFAQNDNVTIQFLIKGSLSGCTIGITIEENDAGGSGTGSLITANDVVTVTDSWKRVTLSGVLSDATVSRLKVFIEVENVAEGDTLDVQVANVKLEKLQYATSFIPTTTAALTRNAELLKFEISGNLTTAPEACIIKMRLNYDSTTTGTNNLMMDTDDERRFFSKITGDTDTFNIVPNLGNPGGSLVNDFVDTTWNAFDLMGFGYNMQHSSPYIAGYYNGRPDGTNETADDFDDNAWGTYFYIGSALNNSKHLDGIIHEIGFFDQILTNVQHFRGYLAGPLKVPKE
jgi:hypothetical protein